MQELGAGPLSSGVMASLSTGLYDLSDEDILANNYMNIKKDRKLLELICMHMITQQFLLFGGRRLGI